MNAAAATLAAITLAGVAHADIRNGTPWAWDDYQQHIENVGKSTETICDRVAANLETKDLKCVIDRSSWDKFLADEIKKPSIKRIDGLSPWNCGNSFAFFRNYSENEHMPGNDGDGKPVIAELQKKISVFKCEFEDSPKPRHLTYDPKSKTLVFHITRADTSNDDWVGRELQRMKSVFPAVNKFWDDGHNM